MQREGAAVIARQVNLHPPVLLRILPASLLLHFARTRLQAQWRDPLEDFLNDYSHLLRPWLRLIFDELRNSFHAYAAPLMTQLEARTGTATRDIVTEIEADLHRLHEFDEVDHEVE
jgi:hypothetical protein